MEELENQFKCLVGGYYGIETMDNYDLKPYILKDVENYIRNFIEINPINNFNYKEQALKYKDELSLITKLQDSLIILNKIDAPMELILLLKNKLKTLKN